MMLMLVTKATRMPLAVIWWFGRKNSVVVTESSGSYLTSKGESRRTVGWCQEKWQFRVLQTTMISQFVTNMERSFLWLNRQTRSETNIQDSDCLCLQRRMLWWLWAWQELMDGCCKTWCAVSRKITQGCHRWRRKCKHRARDKLFKCQAMYSYLQMESMQVFVQLERVVSSVLSMWKIGRKLHSITRWICDCIQICWWHQKYWSSYSQGKLNLWSQTMPLDRSVLEVGRSNWKEIQIDGIAAVTCYHLMNCPSSKCCKLAGSCFVGWEEDHPNGSIENSSEYMKEEHSGWNHWERGSWYFMFLFGLNDSFWIFTCAMQAGIAWRKENFCVNQKFLISNEGTVLERKQFCWNWGNWVGIFGILGLIPYAQNEITWISQNKWNLLEELLPMNVIEECDWRPVVPSVVLACCVVKSLVYVVMEEVVL